MASVSLLCNCPRFVTTGTDPLARVLWHLFNPLIKGASRTRWAQGTVFVGGSCVRLFRHPDASLVIALLAGAGIVFLQPLRPFLSAAEGLSSTYHVDLIPGFIMLVIAYTIHFWRRRLEVVTATRRDAWC